MTNKKQIEILEEVKSKITESKKGLCWLIFHELSIKYNVCRSEYPTPIESDIIKHIPLFTQRNAIKYANGQQRVFWWHFHTYEQESNPNKEYDSDNRIKFVDWMISELKQ